MKTQSCEYGFIFLRGIMAFYDAYRDVINLKDG